MSDAWASHHPAHRVVAFAVGPSGSQTDRCYIHLSAWAAVGGRPVHADVRSVSVPATGHTVLMRRVRSVPHWRQTAVR